MLKVKKNPLLLITNKYFRMATLEQLIILDIRKNMTIINDINFIKIHSIHETRFGVYFVKFYYNYGNLYDQAPYFSGLYAYPNERFIELPKKIQKMFYKCDNPTKERYYLNLKHFFLASSNQII